MFGQSVEETLKETGEEGVAARASKVESAPSKKEVEDRNLDHAVFRGWCPHCIGQQDGDGEGCAEQQRAAVSGGGGEEACGATRIQYSGHEEQR